MDGVTFGTYHSFRAWRLLLAEKPVIKTPEPDLKLIKVPGSNIILDLTETLSGEVTYGQGEIHCKFLTMEESETWPKLLSEIKNAIHGKRMKIVMDNDPDYYYIGRVLVGEFEPEKKIAVLTITALVEPHKYARHGNGRML